MSKIAVTVIGAGGKMGTRTSTNLAKLTDKYDLTLVENAPKGIESIRARGLEVTPVEEALAKAEVVIFAVPDTLDVLAQEIDLFSGIDGVIAGFRQLSGQAGANDAGAVHTQDGIHHGRGCQTLCQLLGHGVCLLEAGLLPGYVDEVVGMAVSGGKVALGHAQRNVAYAYGNVKELRLHGLPPFLVRTGLVHILTRL